MSDLVNPSQQQPLENAAQIIERFGGIRPMATKVSIAVTTIQGWKKRGVIPANRVEAVLNAAKTHNINIADLLASAASSAQAMPIENTNDNLPKTPENKLPDGEKVLRHDEIYQKIRADQTQMPSSQRPRPQGEAARADNKGFAELSVNNTGTGVPKGVIAVLAGIAVAVAAIAGIMIPKNASRNLEDSLVVRAPVETADAGTQDGMFKGLVPEDWDKQLETLKQQATETAQNVGATAQAVQEDLLGENAGTSQERLVKLEKYVNNVVGENTFSGLTDRFAKMQESFSGQESLEVTMDTLHGMVAGNTDQGPLSDEELMAQLDDARQQNPSLSETLTGVPREDLKAAAMLLAMTQVRDTLHRTDVPFEKDLSTLIGIVGKDDPELLGSLEKLAPSAKEGILSPKGLSDEFRKIAGDSISASLNGEDVSMSERTQAKLNDIFKVEKNGEMISGTKTQKIIEQAQKEIDAGNIESAIDFLKDQLNANELDPIRPWIKRAEAALSAPTVRKAIERAIDLQGAEGYLGGSRSLKKTNLTE